MTLAVEYNTRATPESVASSRDGMQRFMPSETEIYLRFADVDMMQVVHHGAYIHWFEQIRFQFMAKVLELDFDAAVEHRVAFPLISCDAQFKRSFRFGDRPVGYARMQVFKQAKLALHYCVFMRDGWVLGATGTTTHCFLGAGNKLLLKTPEFISTAIARATQRYPDILVRQ